MCLVMSRIIISQLCLSTSILIHDVDLSRSSWWWCASLALKGIFAFSGGVVVLWFLILLYINLYGDRCYYVSIISVGIIISKFTDVIFIYVLPLVGSMVAVTVASWLNLSSASPSFSSS